MKTRPDTRTVRTVNCTQHSHSRHKNTGCVTKCDKGRGYKLAKNSVTYFMDGPMAVAGLRAPLSRVLEEALYKYLK